MRAEGFSSAIVGADRCSIRAHALLMCVRCDLRPQGDYLSGSRIDEAS